MVHIKEYKNKKFEYSAVRRNAFLEMTYSLHKLICAKIELSCKYPNREICIKDINRDTFGADANTACQLIFAKRNYAAWDGFIRNIRIVDAFYQGASVYIEIFEESIRDEVMSTIIPYSNILDMGLEEIKVVHVYTYKKGYTPKESGSLSLTRGGGELSEIPQNGALALANLQVKEGVK